MLTFFQGRGGAGVVTDGGFRDSDKIAQLDMPAYHHRPSSPTNLTLHEAFDINVPIGCGDVAVFPGDYVVGDQDSVIILPAALVDEIAQEAMIMVWRRAETYNPSQSGASTWIFTIARNKRIDRLRRENRPLPDLADPAFAPEPVETGEKTIFRQQEEEKIRHALKNLPEEQAKMIFSAYYEEKSHREIADESGVPLGTVKSRIRLALNRLRAHLDEPEGIWKS